MALPRIALCCAVVALAGCGALPTDAPPATETSTATGQPGVTPAPYAAELTIENQAGHTVRVTASDRDGAGETDGPPAVNRTSTAREIVLDEYFEPQVNYHVEIAVNGTQRWSGTLWHYESYTATVTRNGSVDVELVAVR